MYKHVFCNDLKRWNDIIITTRHQRYMLILYCYSVVYMHQFTIYISVKPGSRTTTVSRTHGNTPGIWRPHFGNCSLYFFARYRPRTYNSFFNRSDFPAAWMNLGIVLASVKRYNESEQAYTTALQYRSKYPDCYYNLGNLVS